MEPEIRPLSGAVVIELGRHVAAAAASNMLGFLGADVIKVETPKGDPYRITGRDYGLVATAAENPLYDTLNDYKRDICLNLKTKAGMDILINMLKTADFFVTNYRDQVLEEMGLTYEDVKKINPRIIYGSALGYGRKGPDAGRAAFDATAFFARSGWAYNSRLGDGPPAGAIAAAGDTIMSSYLVNGLLSAYIKAQRTGVGCEVTTSLMSAGMYTAGGGAVTKEFLGPPKVKKFVDADHPNWIAICTFYPCKDGEWYRFCIMVVEQFWPTLAKALGLEELADDPRFNTMRTQYLNRVELYAIIKQRMLTKTSYEWEEIFRQYDLPVERVAHPDETVRSEQAIANHYSSKVEYESRENIYLPMMPFAFSDQEGKERSRAPMKGADTEDILKEYGYSEEEIADLLKEGTALTP